MTAVLAVYRVLPHGEGDERDALGFLTRRRAIAVAKAIGEPAVVTRGRSWLVYCARGRTTRC